MRHSKSLAMAIALTVSISISAPALAARDRDGGTTNQGPITRIVQVLKRLFGVHTNDLPTVTIP